MDPSLVDSDAESGLHPSYLMPFCIIVYDGNGDQDDARRGRRRCVRNAPRMHNAEHETDSYFEEKIQRQLRLAKLKEEYQLLDDDESCVTDT